MRRDWEGLRAVATVAATIAATVLGTSAPPAAADPVVFLVSTTADSGPGSLRQAILKANVTPNVGGFVNEIRFSLPAGVQRISVTRPLPDMTRSVAIEGADNPNDPIRIELDGSQCHCPGSAGLRLAAADFFGFVTVDTLAIGGFSIGVEVARSQGIVVRTHVGADAAGAVAMPNGIGVEVRPGAHVGVINSQVSGNHGDGVHADSGSTLDTWGNYIGTTSTGSLPERPLPNGGAGVAVQPIRYESWGDRVAFNAGDGVLVTGPAGDVRIHESVFVGNGGRGLAVGQSTTRRSVFHNSFGANRGLDLDIGDDGVDGARRRPGRAAGTPTLLTAVGTTATGRFEAAAEHHYSVALHHQTVDPILGAAVWRPCGIVASRARMPIVFPLGHTVLFTSQCAAPTRAATQLRALVYVDPLSIDNGQTVVRSQDTTELSAPIDVVLR